MMTENQAREAGAKLLELLDDPQWTLYVHENLGWHFSASAPGMRVLTLHCTSPTKYYAMPMPSYSGWCQDVRGFTDPKKAVQYAAKHMAEVARRFIKEAGPVLAHLK